MSDAVAQPPSGILALEAATDTGGVALLEDSRVLAERVLPTSQRSASSLLVAIDELLRSTGRELEEFALIALSIGPGSFTGLRVGLATALGLCFGTERRVVPVPTLAALSTHAGRAAHIVPMLDARRGEVYAGLYGPEGRVLRDDRVADPAVWLGSLADVPGPVHFVGSGALRYAQPIEAAFGRRARILPRDEARPRAASVGTLGARLAASGASLEPAQVELRYLRRPAAEAAAEATAEVAQHAGHSPAEPIS
ncbi:MAG: tRNA (adenosine(37)-N6)-threonylcarbamoyltransferase complex dimerization subunit type 1 TsaB [Myxococcota bacterium]